MSVSGLESHSGALAGERGRKREQKQLYFSTSTTSHKAPEQVPASLRIKLSGKRSYGSLLFHSIRCVENSTLLMTAKDNCLTFSWTALSTTRHLRNKGEVAKKRKIKKRGTHSAGLLIPKQYELYGKSLAAEKLYLRDLQYSQSSSGLSASLFLELLEHNKHRASSLYSMYTLHPVPKAELKSEPLVGSCTADSHRTRV